MASSGDVSDSFATFLCTLRRVVWDRHPVCDGQIFSPQCLSVFSTCAWVYDGVGQLHVVTSTRNRRFVSIPAPAFGVGSRDLCFSRDAALLINYMLRLCIGTCNNELSTTVHFKTINSEVTRRKFRNSTRFQTTFKSP